MPPDQNWSITFEQNVMIFAISNIYIMGLSKYLGTENYAWRLDIVQNFCEFCQ